MCYSACIGAKGWRHRNVQIAESMEGQRFERKHIVLLNTFEQKLWPHYWLFLYLFISRITISIQPSPSLHGAWVSMQSAWSSSSQRRARWAAPQTPKPWPWHGTAPGSSADLTPWRCWLARWPINNTGDWPWLTKNGRGCTRGHAILYIHIYPQVG